MVQYHDRGKMNQTYLATYRTNPDASERPSVNANGHMFSVARHTDRNKDRQGDRQTDRHCVSIILSPQNTVYLTLGSFCLMTPYVMKTVINVALSKRETPNLTRLRLWRTATFDLSPQWITPSELAAAAAAAVQDRLRCATALSWQLARMGAAVQVAELTTVHEVHCHGDIFNLGIARSLKVPCAVS